ncbi:hypothetical protein J7E20_10665 [Bacillus sp. ISL-26]|nr:hypothetical protein [Bacillus sp. ISL-26]MBT2635021.1 hypothetical protein [Bacillus sp. ISL-26]
MALTEEIITGLGNGSFFYGKIAIKALFASLFFSVHDEIIIAISCP